MCKAVLGIENDGLHTPTDTDAHSPLFVMPVRGIMESNMKTEETITTILGGGASTSPLGSHAFLDEFALAYHRAVAERLRAEPETVLERARQNLNRWTEGDAFGPGERTSLEEWRDILGEADVDHLIEIIT